MSDPPPPKLTFKEKLELARAELGLTPAKFARRIGIDRQLLSDWLGKEECSISAQKLGLLAEATGKDEAYWTGRPVLGAALVDEVEDSPADYDQDDTTGGNIMEELLAKQALSFLKKLRPAKAMQVIDLYGDWVAAKQKEQKSVPFGGM